MMEYNDLKKILAAVKSGALSEEQALIELRDLPFADLGHSKIDHHRCLRQGAAEVVFAQGKDLKHLIAIVKQMVSRGAEVLITRASAEQAKAIRKAFSGASHNPLARTLRVRPKGKAKRKAGETGQVMILSGGTADAPVVEEARETLEWLGFAPEVVNDVGVAGIHRLLSFRDRIAKARVIIVVAGMEGALASVVAGLVDRPVIGVPTSVGYGAGAGGIAALYGMLNSCGAGVTVVNIDNGFGAAYAALRILRSGECHAG